MRRPTVLRVADTYVPGFEAGGPIRALDAPGHVDGSDPLFAMTCLRAPVDAGR